MSFSLERVDTALDSLGQKIRKLRKEQNLTQHDLGGDVVTASMISQIEGDKATPSANLLQFLSSRLGVDLSLFIDDMAVKTDQTHSYRRARTLMEAKQFEEASVLLEALSNPVLPQFREETLYYELVDCYEALQRLDDAARVLLKIVAGAFFKNDLESAVHAYYRLGRLERRRDRLQFARTYFRQAALIFRRHPTLSMPVEQKIYTAWGRVCLALSLPAEALTCYQTAKRLAQNQNEPEMALIHHGVATLQLELGAYEEARQETEMAIRLYEHRKNHLAAWQCRMNLAVIERKSGRYESALRMLGLCHKKHETRQNAPLLAGCKTELTLNMIALQRFQEAVTLGASIHTALLDPVHAAELHCAIADAYRHLGAVDLTLVWLEQATNLAPSIPLRKHRLDAYRSVLSVLQALEPTHVIAVTVTHIAKEMSRLNAPCGGTTLRTERSSDAV